MIQQNWSYSIVCGLTQYVLNFSSNLTKKKEMIRSSINSERRQQGLSAAQVDILFASIVFDDYLTSLSLYFTGFHHLALLLRPPLVNIFEPSIPPSVYFTDEHFDIDAVDVASVVPAHQEAAELRLQPKVAALTLLKTTDVTVALRWILCALQSLSKDYARILLSFRLQRADLAKERLFANTVFNVSVRLIRATFPNKVWPAMTQELQRTLSNDAFGCHQLTLVSPATATNKQCPAAKIRDTRRQAKHMALSLKSTSPVRKQKQYQSALALSSMRSPLIMALLPTPKESYDASQSNTAQLHIGLPALSVFRDTYGAVDPYEELAEDWGGK